ncbi:hypothetical protein GH5_07562 [Leishmania sp. Ghana 2012 LV757]|uniref:hypothetical protein n=1 Tax=Leishmania sp. Ghana 2012 LV757 TaxID=2803181 RepID=UPI001B77BD44|nr:hypothetical protein GH5_07562 [Leishmania sp. Ghana 2012 LV757]
MKAGVAPLDLCAFALCGAFSHATPSAAFSAASSSSHTEIWMTTPAPAMGSDVEFPCSSIAYQREQHDLPPPAFFNTHWYVGIIIIVLVVLAAYILLALWVRHHFQYSAQRTAKTTVKQAYVTNGFFDLDRYIGRDARGSLVHRRHRSTGRGGSGTSVFRDHSSGSLGECEGSESSYSGSDSPPKSKSDEDSVVEMNPLHPQ